MSKADFHTQAAIAMDRPACTHDPGPENGFPCPMIGCSRGAIEWTLERDGKRFRRRQRRRMTIIDGAFVERLVFEWFDVDAP